MYNSLSKYLNTSFKKNTNIQLNEGFSLSNLFKHSSTNKEQEAAKGFFGIIGTLFSKLTGNDSTEDEITKTLREQEEKAEQNAKEREEKLAASSEGAFVAKIKAKFAQKENQMDLVNARKCAAYDAKKKQLEDEAKFWEKNKTEFSAEQIAELDTQREEAFKQLGGLEKSDLQRMNMLAGIISCDKDGKPLSKEDILKKIKKPTSDTPNADYDEELAGYVEEFNKLAKKYGKAITESMTDKQFQNVMGKYQQGVLAIPTAENALEAAKKQKDDFDKKAEQVAKYNEKMKKHNDAVEKQEKLEQELAEFEKGKIDGIEDSENKVFDVVEVDGKKKVKVTNKDSLKLALIQLATHSDDVKKDNSDEIDINKYKAKLASYGIPETVIDAIVEQTEGSVFEPNESKISDAINALDGDDLTNMQEKFEQKLQQNYDGLTLKIENAKNEVKNNEEPKLNDGNYNDIKNLSDSQRLAYDVTTSAGKDTQTKLADGLKEAEKQVNSIKKSKEAAAEQRKARIKEYTADKENRVPDALKDKVKEATQGVGYGEIKKNGKVGIEIEPAEGENGPKFIPKPGPNASEEDIKKYDEAKRKKLLNGNLENIKPTKIKVEEETKNGTTTYKYYTLDKDGKQTSIDEEKAIEIYAENQKMAEHQAELLKYKQDLAKLLTSCIKNGELDKEKFKKLSESDKASIIDILKEEDGIDKCFKGVDLAGNKTISDIKKIITDDNRESILDAMEDFEVELEDENYEETGEDDKVEDDDEHAENENGDKLVKVNGKWYKKSDLDENGDPIDDAEVQTKRKLINPQKVWKQRTIKSGPREGSKTKSYYNKNGDSISKDEFKKKLERYNKKKQGQGGSNTTGTTESVQSKGYTSLSNYLLETFNR